MAAAAPIPEPRPRVEPRSEARNEPRRTAPERETALDPGRVKGNFEQDDLDVPAFIRKRRDVQ